MNAEAVALAADSAITVSLPSGQTRSHVLHDKIRRLSGSRVGILSYGATRLAGIPWDAIVTAYTDSRPGPRERVTDHRLDFCRWLSVAPWMSEGRREQAWKSGLVALVDNRLQEAEGIPTDHRLAGEPLDFRLEQSADRLTEYLRSHPLFEGRDDEDVEHTFVVESREYDEAIDKAVAGRLTVSRRTRLALHLMLAEASLRDATLPTSAGLVFAGFGQSEMLPAYSAVVVSGYTRQGLRLAGIDDRSIKEDGEGVVEPFSETDEPNAFIKGPQFAVGDEWRRKWKGLLRDLQIDTEKLVRAHNPELGVLAELLRKYISTMGNQAFEDGLADLSSSVSPADSSAVGILSRNELAAVAENLVRLTMLRQQVSLGAPQTVGGHVDVAIISRFNGFSWLRHKALLPQQPTRSPQYAG